jgi:U3 small nucleolar RNA-associated protein 18
MATKPQFISPLTQAHFSSKEKDEKHKKSKRDPNHARNEAKRARLEAESIEEKRLTSLLFGNNVTGDDSTPAAWFDEDDNDGEVTPRGEEQEGDDEEEVNHGALFQIDRKGAVVEGLDENESDKEGEDDNDNDDENSSKNELGQTSAWVDEDDEKLTVSLQKMDRVRKLRSSLAEDVVTGSAYEEKLRERYQTTMSATSRTDWAKLPQSDSDDESLDSESEENNYTASKLLSSTAPLVSNTRLQPNILNTVRCPDANIGHYNNSTLNAVHFHPGSDEDEPLLLTAGLDKTLRFFKINGSEGGEKIHGVHFPHLPIHCASFLSNTGNVVVSGRRSFFYIYDAVAGKVSPSD